MPILFEAIEKGQDHGSVECGDIERDGFHLQLPVRVLQEQTKCVSITGDSLRADMFMLQQVFDEESL